MDCLLFLFLVGGYLSLSPTLTGGQPACPSTGFTYVGHDVITSSLISSQSNHSAGQTVIVFDADNTVSCTCGVVTAWEVARYDDRVNGCRAFTCDVNLLVFRNLNVSAMTATLVGFNAKNLNSLTPRSRNRVVTIAIPPSERIPVQYGDYLGWDANPSAVSYYEEQSCSGSCPSGLSSTPDYFYGSYKSTFTPGALVGFYDGPAKGYPYDRYFGFRAMVSAGTYPYFINLPKTLALWESTSVGTVVYSVTPADAESQQTLTMTLLKSCPSTSFFTFDPVTGNITLIRSLIGSQSVHSLTIQVSDQCTLNSSNLVVNVIPTQTTTPQTTTKKTLQSVVGSPAGISLLIVTGLASLVALTTSIGICYTGSQISDVTKELAEVTPKHAPDMMPNYDRVPNMKDPNFQQPNRERNNFKQNDWNNRQDYSPQNNSPSTPRPRGTVSPSNINMTPVEHPDTHSTPRPNPPSRNSYPPRDMLFW